MRVAFVSVLERVANLFATPFASEPFSCQEQKKNPAEADPFVHAIWRGALLLVDLIVREPLPVASCSALLGGGCTWTIGACWSIAACALPRACLFQADWCIRL